jgi:hypothetical protein
MTMPHWCNESAWRCFLMGYSGNFYFKWGLEMGNPSDSIKTYMMIKIYITEPSREKH